MSDSSYPVKSHPSAARIDVAGDRRDGFSPSRVQNSLDWAFETWSAVGQHATPIRQYFGAGMLISGHEIRKNLGNAIQIEPFDSDRLNPNSYNLCLHNELLVYEEVVLDTASPSRYRRIEIPGEGMTLQPGVLYLGRTAETTATHGFVPMIQGRSSLGRLGLFISPGGSLGHVGYCGTWTLEMHCVQPVKIYPGMQVCQIFYMQIQGEIEEYNSDKYQNSNDIQPSLIYRELGGKADGQLELDFNALVRRSDG